MLAAAIALARRRMAFWRRPANGGRAQGYRPQARAAAHDLLTDLPSRVGVAAALDKAFDRADTERRPLCLLYIGVDGFSAVNDGHGHEVGDRLLAELAARMKALVRQGAPLARIAGDEFMLLAPGNLEAGRHVAAQLLALLAKPFTVGADELAVSCSIGIAEYPRHGGRHNLTGAAMTAMRAAKQLGGGAHAEYDPRMGSDQREHNELARDLRLAVEKGQLELFYQPKIDARSMQITAAEALLRWHHPQRGVVSPALFIPIAEQHRLICGIGNWVIEEAARQAAVWRDMGLRMRVAVNVSGYQMRQDDFVDRLAAALRKHRLQPARFTCEITETVAMEDTAVTAASFERLGALGVHVSIDDFGTGHSSLAALRKLPAAELKVDRAFVNDLGTSADARTIVAAVLQMARTLGLRVVAEGVETVAQRDQLAELGCDEMQGFLFARPMSARALGLWAMDDGTRHSPAFASSLFKESAVARPGPLPSPASPASPRR
jgi:diguanylate cyclase (GGDEF)-like protein